MKSSMKNQKKIKHKFSFFRFKKTLVKERYSHFEMYEFYPIVVWNSNAKSGFIRLRRE